MKKMAILGFILVLLLTLNVYGETSTPLAGYWEATQINVDGEDMDLTGAFGEFVSASVEFTDDNTFTITTSYFGDIVKQQGSYAVSDGGKIAFYVDGKLSTGTYEYAEETLVLEESISGEPVTFHLKQAERIEKQYAVGDIVTFGSYEQDDITANGKEPIEWIILDKREDGSLVLLCKYALDCKPYNIKYTYVTWERCTLRKWLNEDFYNTAFSAAERAKIVPVTLENEDNPYWGATGGKATEDRVWLLSINEVTDEYSKDKLYSYFTDDASRMCAPTKYAVAQGADQSSDYTVDGVGACWWWLRSPGRLSEYAASVDFGGSVDGGVYSVGGCGVDRDIDSVRPVVVVLP